MAITDVFAGSVSPVQVLEQISGPAGTAIFAGQAVYKDKDTGWLYPTGNGTANVFPSAVAYTSAIAGMGVTAMKKGLIDLGGTALSAIAFGGTVYAGLTGGTQTPNLATTGAVAAMVGIVEPMWGSRPVAGVLVGDKVLRVDL